MSVTGDVQMAAAAVAPAAVAPAAAVPAASAGGVVTSATAAATPATKAATTPPTISTVAQALKQLMGTLSIPPLTSAQITQLFTTLQTMLSATDVGTLLATLPAAAIQLTQDVASFNLATHTQQAAVVSAVLQTYISNTTGLTSAQVADLNVVVQTVVTKFVVLLPQIESGLVKGFTYIEGEVEASTCWQKMCGKSSSG
jgi:hypothetical protein